MREEKQIYNEPVMEIVRLFVNGDVVTLSSDSQGQPGSEGFDDMFGQS